MLPLTGIVTELDGPKLPGGESSNVPNGSSAASNKGRFSGQSKNTPSLVMYQALAKSLKRNAPVLVDRRLVRSKLTVKSTERFVWRVLPIERISSMTSFLKFKATSPGGLPLNAIAS